MATTRVQKSVGRVGDADGGAETARPCFQVASQAETVTQDVLVRLDSQLNITVCTIGPGEYTEQGVARYYGRAWVEI